MCKRFIMKLFGIPPTGSTIEELITKYSAGMNDKEKSAYASEIDQAVFDLLLKVDIRLVPVDINQWSAAARAQYPGLVSIELPDYVLYTVTEEELQAVLSRDWTNLVKYVADMFDCDKFADLLVARLEKYFQITAVREVWGNTTAGYHAFCLAVVRENESLIARLIEPQTDDIFITEGPMGTYSPEKMK